jgi:hypothetical protein
VGARGRGICRSCGSIFFPFAGEPRDGNILLGWDLRFYVEALLGLVGAESGWVMGRRSGE